MTNKEFSSMFPQSKYTVDSFLLLLKNSRMGELYSCEKDSISLNSIKSLDEDLVSITIDVNQIGLIINSQNGADNLGIPLQIVYENLSAVSITTYFIGDFNDLIFRNIMNIGKGYATVAVFDLW